MVEGGVWISNKGTTARVVCAARAEDAGPTMIIWQDVGTGRIYYTTMATWMEQNADGVPRFRRLI